MEKTNVKCRWTSSLDRHKDYFTKIGIDRAVFKANVIRDLMVRIKTK